MKYRIKPLSLAVGLTVTLLTLGAFLVVVGLFDQYLGWDIFSPEAEQLLFGLFGSCVALGGFGAVISVVLGIQEVTRSLRRLLESAAPEAAATVPEAPRRTYLALAAGVMVLLVLTLGVLSAVNQRVLAHRLEVFKLISQDQMRQLGPRLAAEVRAIPQPCESCVTPTLTELFRTLDGLTFCQSATLFLADPGDETVLWRYPDHASRQFIADHKPAFERFFIARDDDRAVKLALQGDTAWIDQKNNGPGFVWYHVIRDGHGKARGVLQIVGNQQESFREYEAVAQAAQRR